MIGSQHWVSGKKEAGKLARMFRKQGYKVKVYSCRQLGGYILEIWNKKAVGI